MIAFFLNMPSRGSWNNQWSGEGRLYARVRKDCEVPKEYIDQSFSYRWDDGWVASVEIKKVDSKEAAKIRKNSVGFYGYDWMIDSIIDHRKIITPDDYINQEGTDEQKWIYGICQIVKDAVHNKDFTNTGNVYLTHHNLADLINNNYIDESTELYSGGPTVADILRFMTKYKDEMYFLTIKAENKQIKFIDFGLNIYYKVTDESANEIDKMLKNAPTIENQIDGKNKRYIFS